MKRLYPIVDVSMVEPTGVPSVTERIIQGGAGIVQLRMKSDDTGKFLELARRLRDITEKSGVILIVNDRVDIALLSRADGVHLGMEDIPPRGARRLLGPGAVIGLSTHTPRELKEADGLFREGLVDYISFGPIFPTDTKKDARPAVGTSMLRLARELTTAPIIAIGGITEENLKEVINSGADAVSIVSAILNSSCIEEKVSSILRLAS